VLEAEALVSSISNGLTILLALFSLCKLYRHFELIGKVMQVAILVGCLLKGSEEVYFYLVQN